MGMVRNGSSVTPILVQFWSNHKVATFSIVKCKGNSNFDMKQSVIALLDFGSQKGHWFESKKNIFFSFLQICIRVANTAVN